MRIAKFRTQGSTVTRLGVIEGNAIQPFGPPNIKLGDILHTPDPAGLIARSLAREETPLPIDTVHILPPIDDQEVWGAGVTYERSKVARQEESESGGSFYDLVYSAERPELFFKASPSRVVGHGGAIRVRQDTKWCVPEPELTLVIDPDLRLVGYTIGNDVSARDIEGQNPLYLPQAKVYDACCALGPCITLAEFMPPIRDVTISLKIERDGAVVSEDSTSASRIVRKFADLIAWLGRDQSFPEGAFLMTGTGIVPPDDFSLQAGDLVHITIDGIGTLTNSVVQGPKTA